MKSRLPLLAAGEQFANGRVVAHDVHRLQLRRGVDRADNQVGQGGVDLYLAPALTLQELVYLQLADGLQAYPLGTHLARLGVLHRVHVDQTLGFPARLRDGAPDGIHAARTHHLLPIFHRQAAHHFLVLAHRVAEQILLALVLMEPVQAAADVAHVVHVKFLLDEAHRQHQTVPWATCQVAERLLDAVVELVALSLRIISCLAYEVHCDGKVTTFSRRFWVLQTISQKCHI